MNKENAKKLKDNAQRTIKIIDMLENGATAQQVVEKLAVNRSLVEYYRKQLALNL